MRWLINLFKREHNQSRAYTFLSHYTDCEAEITAMKSYIREQIAYSEHGSCSDLREYPSRQIRLRYFLNINCVGLAWHLLEQYFKGNITIKKDEADNNH
jgi:hypothetical protein